MDSWFIARILNPSSLGHLPGHFYWVAVNANRTSEHGISHIPRRDGFYVWILTVSLYISLFFTLLFAVWWKSALLAYRLAEMWSTSNLFKQLNLKLCRYLNFYMSESCQPPALSEVGAFNLDGWFLSVIVMCHFCWEQGLKMAGHVCLNDTIFH